MKKILLIFSVLVFLTACSKDKANGKETKNETKNETISETVKETKGKEDDMTLNQATGYQEGNIKVKMTTSLGEIDLILFPEVAPKAVENFVKHAKDGYYNDVTFHRVIEDFMIQGGDPTATGAGGESIWGAPFEDEFSVDFRHFYGALSMANAGPKTNGSQFFIVTAKEVPANILSQMRELGADQGYPDKVVDHYKEVGGAFHLDGKHTVFGQVVSGMDVVEKISKVQTDQADKPLEDVKIEKIEVEE